MQLLPLVIATTTAAVTATVYVLLLLSPESIYFICDVIMCAMTPSCEWRLFARAVLHHNSRLPVDFNRHMLLSPLKTTVFNSSYPPCRIPWDPQEFFTNVLYGIFLPLASPFQLWLLILGPERLGERGGGEGGSVFCPNTLHLLFLILFSYQNNPRISVQVDQGVEDTLLRKIHLGSPLPFKLLQTSRRWGEGGGGGLPPPHRREVWIPC